MAIISAFRDFFSGLLRGLNLFVTTRSNLVSTAIAPGLAKYERR